MILKTDFRNAFDERRRADILNELFNRDSLRPLWRICHWAYKAPLLIVKVLYVLPSCPRKVYVLGSPQVLGADDLNLMGLFSSVVAVYDKLLLGTRTRGSGARYWRPCPET